MGDIEDLEEWWSFGRSWLVRSEHSGHGLRWLALPGVSRRRGRYSPGILGLAGPMLAWLTAFVGLLGTSTGRRPELAFAVSWILSASVALFQVILTDAAVNRLHGAGRASRRVTYWLLGVAALLPAWGIALLGLGWTRP